MNPPNDRSVFAPNDRSIFAPNDRSIFAPRPPSEAPTQLLGPLPGSEVHRGPRQLSSQPESPASHKDIPPNVPITNKLKKFMANWSPSSQVERGDEELRIARGMLKDVPPMYRSLAQDSLVQ